MSTPITDTSLAAIIAQNAPKDSPAEANVTNDTDHGLELTHMVNKLSSSSRYIDLAREKFLAIAQTITDTNNHRDQLESIATEFSALSDEYDATPPSDTDIEHAKETLKKAINSGDQAAIDSAAHALKNLNDGHKTKLQALINKLKQLLKQAQELHDQTKQTAQPQPGAGQPQPQPQQPPGQPQPQPPAQPQPQPPTGPQTPLSGLEPNQPTTPDPYQPATHLSGNNTAAPTLPTLAPQKPPTETQPNAPTPTLPNSTTATTPNMTPTAGAGATPPQGRSGSMMPPMMPPGGAHKNKNTAEKLFIHNTDKTIYGDDLVELAQAPNQHTTSNFP